MGLQSYRAKRTFSTSPEPKGRLQRSTHGRLRFVVQKHAARTLHYDFRLELDGVLKSWAVPKGPSSNPKIKRLAIMVEDHPYEYRNFEGVIPEGYGAGTVKIWDQGTYSVEGNSKRESERLIRQGLKKGVIHFSLEGERLHGQFALVQLTGRGNQWLLIKQKDAPPPPKKKRTTSRSSTRKSA